MQCTRKDKYVVRLHVYFCLSAYSFCRVVRLVAGDDSLVAARFEPSTCSVPALDGAALFATTPRFEVEFKTAPRRVLAVLLCAEEGSATCSFLPGSTLMPEGILFQRRN